MAASIPSLFGGKLVSHSVIGHGEEVSCISGAQEYGRRAFSCGFHGLKISTDNCYAQNVERTKRLFRTFCTESDSIAEEVRVPEFELRICIQTPHSYIQVVDIHETAAHSLAGLRILMLDDSGNIHSVYDKKNVWSEAYWDEFAAIVPLLSEGPVAFLGLAGGTSVRLFRTIFPNLELHAWEIDGIVVDIARDFFDLSKFVGDKLTLHVGDAFAKEATVEGGFAGIVVDLFSNGKVASQLENADTWRELRSRLRPNGRIIANLGGPMHAHNIDLSENKGEVAKNQALTAMAEAFPDEVNYYVTSNSDMNTIALTGELPCPLKWASELPDQIKHSASEWKKFEQ